MLVFADATPLNKTLTRTKVENHGFTNSRADEQEKFN